MYKKTTKIFLALSLIFFTVLLALIITSINGIHVFPSLLFHFPITQSTLLVVFSFLILLAILIALHFMINNKYLSHFFIVIGFTALFITIVGIAFSLNQNETIFFSSPDNEHRFAVVQRDLLHNTANDIYQIKNHLYAVQVAHISTSDLEDSFALGRYEVIWEEADQFTIYLPDEADQEVTIYYDE